MFSGATQKESNMKKYDVVWINITMKELEVNRTESALIDLIEFKFLAKGVGIEDIYAERDAKRVISNIDIAMTKNEYLDGCMLSLDVGRERDERAKQNG